MLSLSGKSDRVLPCCGNKETEAHAVTCHAGKDVEIFERLFSMKEVAHHCDPQSCWVVVDNVVYDLTEFQYEVRTQAMKFPFFFRSIFLSFPYSNYYKIS